MQNSARGLEWGFTVPGSARRIVVLLALIALPFIGAGISQPAERPPDTMEARLRACAACHGEQGQGTDNDYFPRLAGKPAGYLMNQLVAFRDGRRRYPPMNYLLEYHARLVPAADRGLLLRHCARRLPPPATADVSSGILARGQAIVTHGDPARGVPACSGCHGPTLTGMEPAIPGLVGLHAQLHQRATGRIPLRHAHRPRAGLHATGCRQPDRERRDRRRRLARVPPAPADPSPVPHGSLADAAGVRQRTELSRGERHAQCHLVGHRSARVLLPIGGCRLALGQDAALLAKGEYLARAGDCIACHTNPGGALFAGGLAMPTPFGTLYSSNITPDRDTGIGTWTADQFYAALHTGRFPDGGLMYPAMPYGSYTKVTRADSDAIYAYLRSVPPVHQPNRPHDLRFPYDNRSLILGWRTLFFNEGEYQPDPTKSAEWNRGAYLVEGLGHCGDVSHADQCAGRQLAVAGVPGRPDPDAELVRAVADLQQGGRPRRLEHRGDRAICCAPACRIAAPSMGRWRKSCSTACNI